MGEPSYSAPSVVEWHEERFERLHDIRPLRDLPLDVSFTLSERQLIVAEALKLISEVYVHLPMKQALRGVDPQRQLAVLALRLAQQAIDDDLLGGLGDPPPWSEPAMTDADFHEALIEIFAGLHDLHTQYLAPEPLRSLMAFLPLLVEECHDGDERKYIASKVCVKPTADPETLKPTFDPEFKPGVEITHWNAVPIEQAVRRSACRSAGANPEAQRARGIEALTCRWLGTSVAPDEEHVAVGYRVDGEARELRFPWLVGRLPPRSRSTAAQEAGASARATRLGLDSQSEMRRRVKYELYARSKLRDAAHPALDENGTQPLAYDSVGEGDDAVGYLRIHTFQVPDVDGFIAEIARILQALPGRGLIIDIRGNPGGDILAGERLLQLLTPTKRGALQREQLEFRTTPTTLTLAQNLRASGQGGDSADAVVSSIGWGLRIGSSYSRGSDVGATPASAEHVDRSPLVLIVDALCYSTAEVFAAGFQDNALGPIIGTSACTGGGGANSWTYDALRQIMDTQTGEERRGRTTEFRPLPLGKAQIEASGPGAASFVVAARRLTRAGPSAGETFEERGVKPERTYTLTQADLLDGNTGLQQFAAQMVRDLASGQG
jgi:C-terminal processing protease CtpA/Prc